MRTNEISKMILAAIADEERSGRLAKVVVQAAQARGRRPNLDDVQGVVKFVREYVEHVPLYLQQGVTAARGFGLQAEMGQVLLEIENYWFEANDLVPDHQGLIGVVDDAYASLALLQGLSDYCQSAHGRPLVQQDLGPANKAIRVLIGEPVGSVLDQRVGMTLASALMQKLLAHAMAGGFAYPAAPDPIWGNASIDEIVTARLGAMGVV